MLSIGKDRWLGIEKKSDKNLLDTVNRLSNEARMKGYDGIHFEEWQSTVGNQTFNPNVLEVVEVLNNRPTKNPRRRRNPGLKVGDRIQEGKRKGTVKSFHSKGTVDVLFDDMDYVIRRQLGSVKRINPRRKNSGQKKWILYFFPPEKYDPGGEEVYHKIFGSEVELLQYIKDKELWDCPSGTRLRYVDFSGDLPPSWYDVQQGGKSLPCEWSGSITYHDVPGGITSVDMSAKLQATNALSQAEKKGSIKGCFGIESLETKACTCHRLRQQERAGTSACASEISWWALAAISIQRPIHSLKRHACFCNVSQTWVAP